MGSKWRKAKMALGLNACVHMPATVGDEDPHTDDSAAALVPTDVGLNPSISERRDSKALKPPSRVLSSPDLKLSRSSSRSSKRTCAICLSTMKAGHGHALFTAECSHTFHFHCIASNVKYGNHLCPVCRAKWKEVPFHPLPRAELPPPARDNRVNPINWSQEEGHVIIPRRVPRANSRGRRHHNAAIFHASEPNTFDDDEPVDPQPEPTEASEHGCTKIVTCTTYPELSAVQCYASQENFAILVHLKAPVKDAAPNTGRNVPSSSLASQASRAPVDLVTVLDVSGSMAGTKLALLKRAMGFVIQNLGPSDRLAVVAFSSSARRLFPLRRMVESGKQVALQAVNALVSSGGTNIAEGLKKGAKVIEDRKEKNPVCSIILLSDGQDTYTMSAPGSQHSPPDYKSLLPSSIRSGLGHRVPVHAFGFGSDHDPASMHTISETSRGTFSFIEAENVIQDAFAQCIGGLLSVVVQELHVGLECVHPSVQIGTVKSGSYANHVAGDNRTGFINVGDLYADEERDFLISVDVPPASQARDDTVLLKVKCTYKDSISKETVKLGEQEVRIRRPEVVITRSVSIEVDRQRNRLRAAEAMACARTAAESGSLSDAVSILEKCRQLLAETPSSQSGDRLCAALDAELKEMQDRMVSRQRYEASGRAYVLSGLSSHSWQRATARGDSTDSTSLVLSYQTPSMADMLMRSQTMILPPNLPPGRSHTSPQGR